MKRTIVVLAVVAIFVAIAAPAVCSAEWRYVLTATNDEGEPYETYFQTTSVIANFGNPFWVEYMEKIVFKNANITRYAYRRCYDEITRNRREYTFWIEDYDSKTKRLLNKIAINDWETIYPGTPSYEQTDAVINYAWQRGR